MKYCDNCGKALRDTALFCTGCGMPCEEDEEVAAENYQIDETERKNRVLTIVLIVLIVLIIGAAIALAVSLTSGKKADSEETTTVQTREITEYSIETATEAPPVTEAQLQPLEPMTMPVVSPTQGSISINNSQAGDSIDRNCYLTVQTEGGNLNMRSGPGSDYNIIAAIPNKTNLFVKECCSNWSLVEYNGKQGWVSTEYLDLGV